MNITFKTNRNETDTLIRSNSINVSSNDCENSPKIKSGKNDKDKQDLKTKYLNNIVGVTRGIKTSNIG